MSRFLVVSTAFPAHADWGGLLGTARHLAASGEDVLWATGAKLIPYIRDRGLPVREIPVVDPHHGGRGIPVASDENARAAPTWRLLLRGFADHEHFDQEVLGSLNYLVRALTDAWLQVEAVAISTEALLAVIDEWKPDVMIAEPLMLPAAMAAEVARIRLASCGYPGALLDIPTHPGLAHSRSVATTRVNRIRQRLGLTESNNGGELFFSSRQLQIVYLPPDWFGTLSATPSAQVHFVGATSSTWPIPSTYPVDGVRPLIVLAVSSSYAPARDALQVMFDGVRRVDGLALIGGPDRERAGPLPDHVRWESWLDYDAVLPTAAAMVHHGGLGTSHAAVRAGIPQVVIPGPIDQCLHADAIDRSGAGISCHGTMSGAVIGGVLREVIGETRYRQNARDLREHFARFGGVPRAAELLMSLARTSIVLPTLDGSVVTSTAGRSTQNAPYDPYSSIN